VTSNAAKKVIGNAIYSHVNIKINKINKISTIATPKKNLFVNVEKNIKNDLACGDI
jgi:hypothetical protein